MPASRDIPCLSQENLEKLADDAGFPQKSPDSEVQMAQHCKYFLPEMFQSEFRRYNIRLTLIKKVHKTHI